MSPVETSNGTVYPTVDEFFDSLPWLQTPAVLRYRRRFERKPRKFWERGGRRRAR